MFGEDVGKIGGVNQTAEGLQEKKYSENRVFDTGIREATIVGQGIGLAMRGLRPIAEIQYFDYLMYGLEILSDDLATLQYRTRGGQKKAPLNYQHPRTPSGRDLARWLPLEHGHQFHSWVYVLVPRNMTQLPDFTIPCCNPTSQP